MVTTLKYTDLNVKTQSTCNNPDRFVLIIGAMKAGTTSLFEILSQHPQICSSRLKEPDYFIKDREDKFRKDYLALWDWKNDSHFVALESSVAYTKAPFITGVPERISKTGFGEYRFIYMLRDPLSRIESQVRHGLFAGWGESLDAGISDDLIKFSSYAMQVDHYLKYFSRDNIVLITLEEFRLNPNSVLAQICGFLEIDNEFEFANVEESRNSGDFFNASPGVARITQGELGQFLVQKMLPIRVKKWLRKFISKLSKGEGKTSNLDRWRLMPEERILILKKLAGDLKRLDSEFGIDVRRYWHIPADILDER